MPPRKAWLSILNRMQMFQWSFGNIYFYDKYLNFYALAPLYLLHSWLAFFRLGIF